MQTIPLTSTMRDPATSDHPIHSLEFTASNPGILIIDKSCDLGDWSRVHEERVGGQSTYTDDRINQAAQGYYRCQWLSAPQP
ncbi:MAG: hypothetical protein H7A46_00905 [Verrucomicrobiales bacterium]|nr:hypothetical protein [Verrucomicrobiales bacterium]